MRTTYILLPFLFASAALASNVVVEVGGLDAPRAAVAKGAATPARQEAEKVMAQRCALCHGADGRANGVMSATLNPRPRDFSDLAWQRSVSDEQLEKVILKGGAGIGRSPIMPANPDLAEKPAVVDELVALLRGFAKRGVVRAFVIDAEGKELTSGGAAPDESGKSAVVVLSGVAPGTVTVRGFFDADEDGKQGKGERAFEKRGVVVSGDEVRVRVP